MVTLLGALFAAFTVFTAVSIFGVFLGTGAPIIALSVMSGFEADLKGKIRATKADVVIETGDDRPFTNWEEVDRKIAGIPKVIGSMPYIETEVIIKHATNPAGMGIILRGIDPARAPRVLGLERTMQEGKIAYCSTLTRSPPTTVRSCTTAPARPATPPARCSRRRRPTRRRPGPHEAGHAPAAAGAAHGAWDSPRRRVYQHTLRVFVGSDVDIACPMCGVGPMGPMPKLKPFRVAGHFYTGMYEFDSKLAYVALGDAQKFLGTPGEVTGIEIRTRPRRRRTTSPRRSPVASAPATRCGPGRSSTGGSSPRSSWRRWRCSWC